MTKRYPITDPPNHHPTPPRVRGHDSIRRAAFIYRPPRALRLVSSGTDRIDRSIDRSRLRATSRARASTHPDAPRLAWKTNARARPLETDRRCSRNKPPRRSRRARCARPPPEAVARSRRAPGPTVRCGAYDSTRARATRRGKILSESFRVVVAFARSLASSSPRACARSMDGWRISRISVSLERSIHRGGAIGG